MDYAAILAALNDATLFELYRLNEAIYKEMRNPARIEAVRRRLREGQEITWFDRDLNRLVEAVILQIKNSRVEVRNKGDGMIWDLTFAQLNVDAKPTDIMSEPGKKLERHQIKVGDKVAFRDRDGRDLFGEVIKLNPKTAGVLVGNVQWRVSYGLLIPVIDGELQGEFNLLEGEAGGWEEV